MKLYPVRIYLLILFLTSTLLTGCFNSSISEQGEYSFVLLNTIASDIVPNRAIIITNTYTCDNKDLGTCEYSILFNGVSDQFGIVRIPASVFAKDVFVHVAGFSVLGPIKRNDNIISYESNQQKYEMNVNEKNLSFSLNQLLPQERNVFDFKYQKEFSKKENPENYKPIQQSYNQDPNCPNGQTGKYRYSQGGWVLVDCKYVPVDFGKECISDTDCEFNCNTTSEDLGYFGCATILNGCVILQCHGIKGRCGVYGNEIGHIIQEGRVTTRCIR